MTKNFLRVLSLGVLATTVVTGLVSCGGGNSTTTNIGFDKVVDKDGKTVYEQPSSESLSKFNNKHGYEQSGGEEVLFTPVSKDNIKVGLITLHDESSTYDKNFIDSMKRALDRLGMHENQLELVTGVPEDNECLDKANQLANSCNVVFADSFGHEDYMIQAAEAHPNVRFAHATGTKAHTKNLNNYSNAFASIYEGRYLAGVAAGMKLKELKEQGKLKASAPVIGYVGAYPYAEVKSGYTAFYLGAKSIVDDVTMNVKFTSSWYDPVKEKDAANALITGGADLISQHADSMGAPEACEENNIPNVTYNGTTESSCPNTYLVSSKIDWAPYFEYMINQTIEGKRIKVDWTGTISTGSVVLDSVGVKCAPSGTQAKIEEVKAKLQNGELNVFDTNIIRVGGKQVYKYIADVNDEGDYVAETPVIVDGIIKESYYRSAPIFDIDIDGINVNK